MRWTMKKLLLYTLIAALVAVTGVAWWLHSNLDAMVMRGISRYGSEMTQARVSVQSVQIRSTDGSGVIRGLTVGNPAGFRTPHALSVGVIEVVVDVRTLADPVVVVKRIVIDSPDVIYERGDASTNFDAIQKNIARSRGASSSSSASSGSKDAESPGRKLIVDELIIRHARAQAGASVLGGQTVSATLPDIALHNVGRAQGGITPAQLGEVVTRALSQRLVASLGVDRVLKSFGDRVKGLFGR
jgi:hypothetical protein